MRQKLLESIRRRVRNELAPNGSLRFLLKVDPEEYLDKVISTVYLYTREKRGHKTTTIYMAELITAIGHPILEQYGQKKNSGTAARCGAFMLYSFELLQMIAVIMGAGPNGHGAYVVMILDDDSIVKLWNELEPSQIEKLPAETPYAPWTTAFHETGKTLVKTGEKKVLKALTAETHPIVFANINKAQETGWIVNEEVFDIQVWALRNRTPAFRDIWDQVSPEAKATKLREAKAISDIAKKFVGKVFYHLYYYDFRGRKYPATAYLHEQGSDVSRGLLLRSEGKVIGEEGFWWLMVSIASNWAGDAGRQDGAKTDKIPLNDRYLWSMDNEEILLSYAENPKVNDGWMKADKPWQFLAACIELKKLREWQFSYGKGADKFLDFNYVSGLEAFIDGSNNGCQHLAALTRDDVTAPHVNLVPLDLPGDLYKYIGDHVWKRLDDVVDSFPAMTVQNCENAIDELIDIKKQINDAQQGSERRKELINIVKEFKLVYADTLDYAPAVYWRRVKDVKERRKIVKRNVMTLPYGGTAYGLGQQQIDDAKKHGIDLLIHMEHKWGSYLGREVYEDCRVSLKRPMQLLNVFEDAGRKAEEKGEFLQWNVPVTDFPVVQHYTEGKVKKTWIQYGPPEIPLPSGKHYVNTLQLNICYIEDRIPSKRKQSQGASPNAIHSLDAAHLALTVARSDFPVTTIHDSFGALLCDMPKLFRNVRETFVELYEADPLTALMTAIDGDISNVEFGDLDISLVLDSEYAFS